MAEILDPDSSFSARSAASQFALRSSDVVPGACSLLAAFVAAIVLAGWAAHAYALVTILPNLPAMAQSTAIAFLIASASLWLQRRQLPLGRPRRAAQALALAVLLIGLITLLRYFLLLIGHASPPLTGDTGHPINRMSPNSAVNFVLLGTALLLTDVRGRGDRWPAQAMALVVALDALVALVGQLYGVIFLYGLSHFLGMAVHTACLFLFLSFGLLLTRPDRGFIAVLLSNDAAGKAARRFLPLALVAPVVLGGVGLLTLSLHRPNAPLLAYLLVVASIGLLGGLVWGNVLALSIQVQRSRSYERQVADLERGRVEDALVASEQRLLFAAESTGIGTWLWDIVNDRLDWSGTCKALFNLAPETEMTRALFFSRIHPDDRPNAEATIARSLTEGTAYDIEYRVMWSDGSEHWLAARGRGYQDATGRPIRFEGTVQDIDEKKRVGDSQRQFLRDVLASVTEGRLILCDAPDDLPAPLISMGDPISVSREGGLRELRHQALDAAEGMAEERMHDLVTAVGESAMNTITHGGGIGTGYVSAGKDGTVQVRVEDYGAGIALASLPKATLARGFSTKSSLGHGFKMMQQVDRVYILTGPGGTTVVLEQKRESPIPSWL